MPSATENAFKKAITSRTFAPVYYIYGADDFRKREAITQALAAAVEPGVREFNVEVRSGAQLDAETVDSLLGTPPLASPRRAAVIENVGALKKDARRALDHYLAHPAADTVVLLVADSEGKADAALVDRAVSVEFKALTGENVPRWINSYATRLGATITPSASALLQQAAGPEPRALASEIDKLASYALGIGETVIDDAAVAAVVGVRRGETLGDLLDRIADRDVAGAIGLIEHVLSQPKASAVTVVMALTTQMLAIGWGRSRRDSGVPIQRLDGEYRRLLSETKAYPWRPWNEAIATWVEAVERWDVPSVDRALEALLATDLALKESRLSSDEQIIESLVFAMCADSSEGATPSGGTRKTRSGEEVAA
jgi:DNA polymerase III subunit delta